MCPAWSFELCYCCFDFMLLILFLKWNRGNPEDCCLGFNNVKLWFPFQREWADAKRELQEEKNNALTLAIDRDQTIKNAIKQVEEMRKDLSNALHAAASAESRAAVAEVLFFFSQFFPWKLYLYYIIFIHTITNYLFVIFFFSL